jgi:hypothetical protein
VRRAIILTAALCAASPMAHAQTWLPIARECAEAIDRQYGCTTACDNQLWPLYARCTVQRFYGDKISAARLDACMQQIWDRRWQQKTCELCGDPVGEALSCAGAE